MFESDRIFVYTCSFDLQKFFCFSFWIDSSDCHYVLWLRKFTDTEATVALWENTNKKQKLQYKMYFMMHILSFATLGYSFHCTSHLQRGVNVTGNNPWTTATANALKQQQQKSNLLNIKRNLENKKKKIYCCCVCVSNTSLGALLFDKKKTLPSQVEITHIIWKFYCWRSTSGGVWCF